MTIIPIFRRELVAASRLEALHSQRGWFAGLLLAMVLGTFAAWYYWANGDVSNVIMTNVADRAFLLIVAVHAMTLVGPVVLRAVTAIAGEKERRTLDFLLITRLSTVEIILGKFAARLVVFIATLAAGLPVILLLHCLGGIDLPVIILAYAGLTSTAGFLTSLAIWCSVISPSSRNAATQCVFVLMAWLMGPIFLPIILPHFGLRLSGWAETVNGLLVASSPLNIVRKLAVGLGATSGLVDAVVWMAELQLIGTVCLLLAAILRLRSAYRATLSDEARVRKLTGRGPVWRLWKRPRVGDDPILWREMYTSRETGFGKALGTLINLGLLSALIYATFYFAKPALVEVWKHGFTSGMTTADRPQTNLFVGLFLRGVGENQPQDAARMQFNLFLRWTTIPMAIILLLAVSSSSCEVITRERARETWVSLLSTPLTATPIVRATILSALWRLREFLTIILVLWTLGVIAGAIHPLGYLVSLVVLAASTWFLSTWGIRAALRSIDPGKALSASLNLGLGLLLFSSVLPFLLPNRFSSVLLGSGSVPFILSLSLASYREMHAVFTFAPYPTLQWFEIKTGEGTLAVLATCMLGTIAPSLSGWLCWRYALADFDRLVGRPWRAGVLKDEPLPANNLVPLKTANSSVGAVK